jgi:TFIIF-interacting CTD phosphatase-like protein
LELESKVQDILGEEISKIVDRHSQEVQTPLEKRKERSQLSQLICQYLDESYNFSMLK